MNDDWEAKNVRKTITWHYNHSPEEIEAYYANLLRAELARSKRIVRNRKRALMTKEQQQRTSDVFAYGTGYADGCDDILYRLDGGR